MGNSREIVSGMGSGELGTTVGGFPKLPFIVRLETAVKGPPKSLLNAGRPS